MKVVASSKPSQVRPVLAVAGETERTLQIVENPQTSVQGTSFVYPGPAVVIGKFDKVKSATLLSQEEQMNLEVRRNLQWSDDKATEGELFIDGEFAGYTLEPPRLDPPTKPRAIPCGQYGLTWAFSPKHKRFVPLVENVPDFEGVEIHIGNYPQDTLGCLLVGETRGKDMIQQSTQAINTVWARVHGAFQAKEAMTITYTEGEADAEEAGAGA